MITQRNGKGAWMQEARSIRAIAKSALPKGLLLYGSPGVGKSRLLGKGLAKLMFLDEIPLVICDVTGGTIDNFLDLLIRRMPYLSQDACEKEWERVIYCDMHGQDGYVIPWPLYRQGDEASLWEISERFLLVLRKCEPELATRSLLGYAPMRKIGLNAGLVLTSLGFQVTEAESLLNCTNQPDLWEPLFQRAEARYPAVKPATAYFREEYRKLRPTERERLTTAFRDRIFALTGDKRLRAMFGGSTGINWPEIAKKKHIVLLDFRHVRGDMLSFKLQWVPDHLFTYIKGRGKSEQPFGVIFDEFSLMAPQVSTGENYFSTEMNDLIQGYMRNTQIWLCVSLQSPLQLDLQMRQTLFSLGSYLVGQATSMDAARVLSDVMFLRNPWRTKHHRTVYRYVPPWELWSGNDITFPQEPVFMPLDEQREVGARLIRSLRQGSFLLRPAVSEAEVSTEVYPVNLSTIDPGEFPDEELLKPLRRYLAARSGIPIDDLIKEQEERLRHLPTRSTPTGHHTAVGQKTPRTRRPQQPPADTPEPVPPTSASSSPIQRRHRIA